MPLPMTQDQVLGILSPCFHAAFLDVCNNRVTDDEEYDQGKWKE